MKWLLILFSIFKPFFSHGSGTHDMHNPIEDLKDMLKKNALKVMLGFAAVSAMTTIFAAGLLMVAVDSAAQYDQNSTVYFSAMITLGISLMLLPVIIGGVLYKKFDNTEDEEVKRPILEHVGTDHPLQDALALLIHDFVKERELKRSQAQEGYSSSRTPTSTEKRHPTQSPTEARVPSSDDFMH